MTDCRHVFVGIGGDDNVGLADLYAGHFAVLVDSCDGLILRLPFHLFIGGIGRGDDRDEGGLMAYADVEGRVGQGDSGNRDLAVFNRNEAGCGQAVGRRCKDCGYTLAHG